MSNAFAIAENAEVTELRTGNPVGGYYPLNTVSKDVWHRLMPSGNAAAIVADTVDNYKSKLNIGALRADITNAPIGGWNFRILNEGYKGIYQIRSYDPATNIVELVRADMYSDLELNLHHIRPSDAIEFIIYPTIIRDFNVCYLKNANDNTIEIGFIMEDKWSGDVQSFGIIEKNQFFTIPTQRIDRAMFRIIGSKDVNSKITWGEHTIRT